jgi:hypothetical protein
MTSDKQFRKTQQSRGEELNIFPRGAFRRFPLLMPKKKVGREEITRGGQEHRGRGKPHTPHRKPKRLGRFKNGERERWRRQ